MASLLLGGTLKLSGRDNRIGQKEGFSTSSSRRVGLKFLGVNEKKLKKKNSLQIG